MSKVKLLLDVIEDIRSLADSLEAVAEAMTHSDATDEPQTTTEFVPSTMPSSTEPSISKEELRAFLGEKSLAGHREAIHAIICKYGVQKFSDVDPKHYAAIKQEAEALQNAT